MTLFFYLNEPLHYIKESPPEVFEWTFLLSEYYLKYPFLLPEWVIVELAPRIVSRVPFLKSIKLVLTASWGVCQLVRLASSGILNWFSTLNQWGSLVIRCKKNLYKALYFFLIQKRKRFLKWEFKRNLNVLSHKCFVTRSCRCPSIILNLQIQEYNLPIRELMSHRSSCIWP